MDSLFAEFLVIAFLGGSLCYNETTMKSGRLLWTILLAGVGVLLFQNCGEWRVIEFNQFLVSEQPTIENLISDEAYQVADEHYTTDDNLSLNVDYPYAKLDSASMVLTQSATIVEPFAVQGSLKLDLRESSDQLMRTGINFETEAVFCQVGQEADLFAEELEATFSVNMNVNLGSCPRDLRKLRSVTQYVRLRSRLEVQGDLHVQGLLVIEPGAQLVVSGDLSFGGGPDRPGAILVDHGVIEFSYGSDAQFFLGAVEQTDVGVVFSVNSAFRGLR